MPAYARPTELAEALGLRAAGYMVLAGGTDLYPGAGTGLAGDVLDITGIAGMAEIEMRDGLRIGAATTWTAIAEADLPPALTALQQAARVVGGRQIQNAATVGGNLCNASPAADGIPPLLALDAEVELTSARGRRRLPLQDYLKGPRRVDLLPDELLTAVAIPEAALQGQSLFAKLGARSHLVISIAMVAVRIEAQAGRIVTIAAAVGACSAIAQRLPDLEASLTGAPVSEAAGMIRPEHLTPLNPIDDIRATGAYRRDAALTLLQRTVAALV